VGESIWDLLFPQRCVGCGKWGREVCEACEVGLGEAAQICPGCGRNSRRGITHPYCREKTVMEGLICLWEYEGVVRKMIEMGKYELYYSNLKELVKLRKRSQDWEELVGGSQKGQILVPVPLFWRRERQRGFNQAKVICTTLSGLGWGKTEELLARVKDTGRQVGRGREERLSAMTGAFQFKISNLKFAVPDAAIVVDDVWTTGATMRECARIVKKAGVKRVWGLVLAR
jgi:ComF family protein